MYKTGASLIAWLLELINPPRRESMTTRQKVARTFVITGTVVIGCIMIALVGASVLVLFQQALAIEGDTRNLAKAVAIVLGCVSGNVICFIILLEIRRIDRQHIPKAEPILKETV